MLSNVKMLDTYQICTAIAVLFVFYCYRRSRNNKWKELGIHWIPGAPVIGNDWRFTFGMETNIAAQKRKYDELGDHKYGGTHLFSIPILLVKDPETVENVLVRDFTNFYDRGLPVNEKADPLQANLFNLAGSRWKHLRNKISPVFTSGKLKTMHRQIIECSQVLMEVLDVYADNSESCDFRETMAKFTTDVIGSCAYGLNMNSLKENDNEFRRMGMKIFDTSIKVKIRAFFRLLLRSFHPKLVVWLNMKTMPKDLDDFFLNLVRDTIALRESDPKYVRNDFVQLLINLKREDDLDYSGVSSPGHRDEENGKFTIYLIIIHKRIKIL